MYRFVYQFKSVYKALARGGDEIKAKHTPLEIQITFLIFEVYFYNLLKK